MTSDRASGAAAGPFAGVQPRNGRQVKWVQNPVLSRCVVGGKEKPGEEGGSGAKGRLCLVLYIMEETSEFSS